MQETISFFFESHRFISYLIIFFPIFVEGEIILLLAGVFSHKGYLDVFDVMAIAAFGAFLHDIFYWSIGEKLSKSGKKRFLFVDLEKIGNFLEKSSFSPGCLVFISKFAWTLNRIVLITYGRMKIPFKKLWRYSAAAAISWSILLVSLGYLFASKTDVLKKNFKTAALLLVGFIVGVVILENILAKTIKKSVIK